MSSSLPENLTGSLLVAHPALLDPNFRRTILFLSEHSTEDGAIGLILNRPTGRSLGDVMSEAPHPLIQQVELFQGGPVAHEQLTIASLQWQENPAAVAFHSFMGRGVEEIQVDPEWLPGLRGFLGYSGWSRGQLENEIAQKAWLVLPPTRELIEMKDPENAWRSLMRNSGPLMKLLSEAPDDPGLN